MNILNDKHIGVVRATAETALRRGNDLLKWWNSANPSFVPIGHVYPDVTMDGFFESMPVEGVVKPGMGCLQTSTFKRSPAAAQGPPTGLREWVMKNALRECSRPDGGGFRYQPLLAREAGPGGAVKPLPDGPSIPLTDIGSKYEWVVQSLGLPDYALALPLPRSITKQMKKLVTESGALIFHPDFNETARPPIAGAVDQVTFGYAVVPWRAVRSVLGFGPGTFFSALKQYRIFLMADHSVTIEVLFIVCPRSEKILDLGGFDPVYGATRLLDALTFRRTRIVSKVHDIIDNYALGHHGRVHVHMLEGMRSLWEETNWCAQSAEARHAAVAGADSAAAERQR